MKKFLLGLLSFSLVLNVVTAGELGDPAAPLKIAEWVKGKPVDLAAVKGKQLVVVEFWATWCPPCRTSIPHLTAMQKKFKDVIFIGVTDEKSDVVKKFVTKMGDQMDYVVAIDDKNQTSTGYMREFNINGIPHAFIVDKEGRVIWQGHPMAGLEDTLELIAAGKYDLAAAKAAAKKEAANEAKQEAARPKLRELAQLIQAGKDEAAIKKLEDELVALDKEAGGLFGGEKFDPAEFRKSVLFSAKVEKYSKAVVASASPEELAKLEKELTTDAPKGFDLKEFKVAIAAQAEIEKISGLIDDYMKAVGTEGDATKAAELSKKVAALEIKDPQILNQIAWTILTDENVKHRDLALATKLAAAGVKASEGKDAAVLDTYARALFDSGKVKEAIEQQQKAVNVAEDADLKSELKATLKKYQDKAAAKPVAGI